MSNTFYGAKKNTRKPWTKKRQWTKRHSYSHAGRWKSYTKRSNPFKVARPTQLLTTSPGIVPDQYYCKFQYGFVKAIVTTASINVFEPPHYFRANSLYDPDRSGTGHQPPGFNRLSLLYQRYCVVACVMEVTAWHISGSATAVFIGFTPDATGFNNRTYEDIKGANRVKTELMSGNPATPTKLRLYQSLPAFVGSEPDSYIGERDNGALINADPVTQISAVTGVSNAFASASVGSVQLDIVLTYYCLMKKASLNPEN